MARAAAVPAPPVVPFWQLPAFRWGVFAVSALILIGGVMWLDKVNRSYQLERRIGEDPRLGPMAAKLKQQIAMAENSGVLKDAAEATRRQIPQALWLGRISDIIENESRDGSIIVLASPHLLAGKMGPQDREDKIKIGRRKYVFIGGRPAVGEVWLISVWRDATGNGIHSAARYLETP
jgi:hypothetical protein